MFQWIWWFSQYCNVEPIYLNNQIPSSQWGESAQSSIPYEVKDIVNVPVITHVQGFGYDHVTNDNKVIQHAHVCIESSGEYSGDHDHVSVLHKTHTLKH